MEKTEEEEEQKSSSLFPLQAASAASLASSSNVPQWLCNTSFNTDLSVVNDAVSSLYNLTAAQSEDDEPRQQQATPKPSSYDLLQSSESDDVGRDSKREAKKHKKRKRRRYSEEEASAANDYASRKSGVGAWATRGSKPSAKDYYFDSRGDRDNLAFGCLYRMDVARYKLGNSAKLFEPGFHALYRWNKMGSILDRDGDLDVLDSKLKTGGRYWSAKHSALERHKNLKRIRIVAHEKSKIVIPGDFIPLSDIQTSPVDVIDGSSLGTSTSEESWEDEVLRKTREFNKMSREHPHDEKIWLSFADFQDRIASMQPQKGARLQTLEKKISILEKATELNPENEELLLCLMKAYQSRDSTDVFIGRWEKILLQHSGSYMLWKEFLHVVQGEFSRFKVSDMRKLYAHAIQALSAACSKQHRQVHQTAKSPTSDPAVIELELGLVDIFLSLCRFEWQAGYQELATALFQAEIEYSLLCPCLFISEQSKQRLFEHFWNGDGARVGEEGALGWSTWLEKEEESRQQVMREETADENDKGGWTGWSEPLSKQKEINLEKTSINLENVADNDVDVDDLEDKLETKDTEQEEDTEALMKMLGIDVNAEANNEVIDTSIWTRWSEEESSRDCNQWMPIHTKSVGPSHMDESPDRQVDEQLLGVILFEDVSEYLFSLISGEARISLLFHFIDFFGGKIPEWMCTNNSSWTEKILSLEAVPDFLSEKLRRVNDVLTKTQTSSCGFTLEVLLGNAHDVSRRTDMMKFLRNAILLCLTAFPRNHILEEAVLVAEDLFLTKMNSCSCSVTPCRGLAKGLLKNDRQDLLLCGVYARREAIFGNIDHARRVFDMALSSIESLPADLQLNAPLIYFWYAETELSNSSGNSSESLNRAIHILSCLGSGVSYNPFKCQPSSLQLLRAHQGFKERIRMLRTTWARGIIDDGSTALICSAALFEELTIGWVAAVEVVDHAFSMVLPEKRSQSHQLEFLFNYYLQILQKHHKQTRLSKFLESISLGLQIYPSSPELFTALVEISHLYTVPTKLRSILDDFSNKKPSVMVWLFAVSYELIRGGSQHRIHGLFERALSNDRLRHSVLLWRCYIAYEIDIASNPSAARRVFFRAIHACPWSKKLWLDGFLKLKSVLSAKEMSDLQEVMRDKELNVRTDIYEILLQDDVGP